MPTTDQPQSPTPLDVLARYFGADLARLVWGAAAIAQEAVKLRADSLAAIEQLQQQIDTLEGLKTPSASPGRSNGQPEEVPPAVVGEKEKRRA